MNFEMHESSPGTRIKARGVKGPYTSFLKHDFFNTGQFSSWDRRDQMTVKGMSLSRANERKRDDEILVNSLRKVKCKLDACLRLSKFKFSLYLLA